MIRIYSTSLGCPKNRVDTERALGALAARAALHPADSPEEADLVFINTCAFISPAVEESVRVVLEAAHRLSSLPKRERPFLAVAGCLIGRYGVQALSPDLPEVDLLLDNRDQERWAERLWQGLAGKCGPAAQGAAKAGPARLLSTGPSYAWLKISDGCRHQCSFCTIPGIRGALRSTAAEMLRDEAALLLDNGVRELVVVAQDVSAWGSDLGLKHGLKSLLEMLLPLPGLQRLRLMYLYPAGVTRDLLRFLKEAGPPFVPYFDVPLQHASPAVLARMGRPFAGKAREVTERIRDYFPEAALRTSLITGFPGESGDDFELLRNFVAEQRFHHLGVFSYQAEEGTVAAAMPEQLPMAEKEARRGEIMAVQAEISEDILESYVGQRLELLVDSAHEDWPGLHTGRVWFQAPEIDGLTYVSGPGVSPGALLEADVVESSVYDLTALTDAEED